jgi:hypothetical protein
MNWRENGKVFIMRSFVTCSSRYKAGGTCGWCGGGRTEIHTEFWWETLTERDELENLSIN